MHVPVSLCRLRFCCAFCCPLLRFLLPVAYVLFLLQVGGQDSLDVAKTRENMAIIYRKQGHYDQALEIYKSVLETKIRVCGHDHPDVAVSYKNLAAMYQSQGNHVQTKEMATKAYHIFLKKLGPDHPQTQGLKPFVDE